MIVPDVNLLVYAYLDSAPQHEISRRWWESLVNGEEAVGIPWAVAIGFVRIMANPRAVENPVPPLQTIEAVREWFSYGHVRPLTPGTRHLYYLREILAATGSATSQAAANLVPDAHIAALALEHDAEVHTNDADFDRFPGVKWRYPLR